MQRKALGKGMGFTALLPAQTSDPHETPGQQIGEQPGEQTGQTIEPQAQERIQEIPIGEISPNRYQPRQHFDAEGLLALAASLKTHGLIQPVTVRPGEHGRFELVSGERRWRAAQMAGFTTIPAIVRKVDERDLVEWAMLENLQREDLNPLEKAQAYARLISQFSLTQEEIAARMGIDRSSVANFLRLLNLPEVLWNDLAENRLTMGHAKVLLSLEDREEQMALAGEIKARGLSVRETEGLVQHKKKDASVERPPRRVPPEVEDIENRLRLALGTKVLLKPRRKGGEIKIEYYSLDDLDRILERLTPQSS